MSSPLFDRREDAGASLGRRAGSAWFTHAAVLALSPGGVAVALGMARDLGTPTDILGISPVTLSDNPADAIGSVVEDGSAVFDPAFTPSFDHLDDLETATDWARFRAHQVTAIVRPDRRIIDIAGRQVVIVDDVLRTPWPTLAAVQFAVRRGAQRVAVAIAVGCPTPLERLELRRQEIFCIHRTDGDLEPAACFTEPAPALRRVPGLLSQIDAR